MNGVLVLDKPSGPTSHDMVLRLRRKLPGVRIGHIGTLDPFATGVLPLCIGRATRLAQYLGNGDKVYEGTVCFGWATDTGDLTGKMLHEAVTVDLTAAQLEPLLDRFRGEILQRAPLFSARKLDGVPLYRYARQGIPVEVEPKKVTIHELELMDIQGCRCSLKIRCSPGTYIRAIAMELGEIIGCGAHLESLRRIEAGEFGLDQAIGADHLDSDSSPSKLLAHLVRMERLLAGYPRLQISVEALRRVANGSPIAVVEQEIIPSRPESEASCLPPLIRLFSAEGELVALGRPGLATASRNTPAHPTESQSLWIHPVAVFI